MSEYDTTTTDPVVRPIVRSVKESLLNNYDPAPIPVGIHVRITEAGDTRVTEDGSRRIIETQP